MDSNLPESTIVSPVLTQPVPVTTKSSKLPFIIGGIVLVLILIGVGGYLFMRSSGTGPAGPMPTPSPQPTVAGAKFFLQADPIEASVGGQIKVTVMVESNIDAANLFIAKLKFSNTQLQAKSINLKSETSASGFIKDWFISNWVENTIDNDTGSVSLVGGVPNPGFKTPTESSGSAMADVIFEVKAPGDSIISFDDTSAIYRNSDNTNILVSKSGVTLKTTGEAPPLSITPTISGAPSEATPSATLMPSASPMPTSAPTAIPSPSLSPVVSPTPSGPIVGDVNQDGKLDFQDLSSLLSLWGKIGSSIKYADLNNDGIINSFDYTKLVKLLKDSGLSQ